MNVEVVKNLFSIYGDTQIIFLFRSTNMICYINKFAKSGPTNLTISGVNFARPSCYFLNIILNSLH